jgi:serine/threonine protein kinase
MPQADARAMFQRWQSEAQEGRNHAGEFAKWMVRNSYLTEYQATLLARGHAEGFFLNQYKILDRCGRGRMAGVYKALHPLEQVVAIKVLPPSKAKDPQLFGRFQREARLSVGLKHRNVVRTFQVGEANGLHFLVMEYLEGETLDEVLQRRGKLMPAEAAPIVYKALLGLQHLHEKNMVHRDLKPSNLMLIKSASAEEAEFRRESPDPAGPGRGQETRAQQDLAEYTVKILDIGLARALSDETTTGKPNDPQLTTEGILLGTPDYMAPEQARQPRSVDIRADIYSLGCVLYHALAGQPPFPDTNIVSQMIRHASEPARPLKEFNPAVPDGLQQIIDYLMAKDPAKRYQTPERAAQALQVFLIARHDQDAEPAVDAKMSSYLTWLEAEENAAKTAQARGKGRGERGEGREAPAPRPSPFPPRHEAKEVIAAQAAEEAATVLEAEPEFDVDLVPLGAADKPPAMPWHDLRLSRRDFVLFGIGAGTVIFALLIGKILAWLFPLKKLAPAAPPAPYLEGDSEE